MHRFDVVKLGRVPFELVIDPILSESNERINKIRYDGMLDEVYLIKPTVCSNNHISLVYVNELSKSKAERDIKSVVVKKRRPNRRVVISENSVYEIVFDLITATPASQHCQQQQDDHTTTAHNPSRLHFYGLAPCVESLSLQLSQIGLLIVINLMPDLGIIYYFSLT